MSRPPFRRHSRPRNFTRVNGRIRAREVRVINPAGEQLGVLPLPEAITKAREYGMDLVEVASQAKPPVCRIVDYGKYRYEQSKKEKENKKHQHATKVKEVHLRPAIDPHDFTYKVNHAVDFFCEDMKVKVTLRFRGRENAHQEIGYEVVKKFIQEVTPWATVDAPPKKVGRNINVMLSPLPKSKRAAHPRGGKKETRGLQEEEPHHEEGDDSEEHGSKNSQKESSGEASESKKRVRTDAAENPSSDFSNSPFSEL